MKAKNVILTSAGSKSSKLKEQLSYYLMCTPGMVWLFLFSIVPMVGILMAFQDFKPIKGVFGSTFIGFENFTYLFSMKDAQNVITNTLIIAIAKILLNLVIPLTFALLLNEVKNLRYKKSIQTIVYLPHFLSWVILASILTNMFGFDGIVNKLVVALGGQQTVMLSDAGFFRGLTIYSDVWKEFGYNAVIYLAALTGISPSLYEAASIDGASRWQQTRFITLPMLTNTVVLLTVLALGNVLNAGFDQVFNMYNPMVYSTVDILDTWVYRIGLTKLQFSLATAAGLFKSVISFALISVSYLLAYKYADYTIF